MTDRRSLIVDTDGVVKQMPSGDRIPPDTIPEFLLQLKAIPASTTWTIPNGSCLRIYRNLKIPASSTLKIDAGGLLVVDV